MLHVELFGRFTAWSDRCAMPLRDGSKAQELFAYLLLNGQRPQTREAVAAVLWNQCTTATSLAYLRKALWQLRAALDKCDATSPPMLELESKWVQVDPARGLWADVIEFEKGYQESQGADGASLTEEASRAMQKAVLLYKGALLPNRYESWCLLERERFQMMYLLIRDKLMDYYARYHRYDEAIEQGTQILRCDSMREHTHRRMMWLHLLRGDRTSALRQYHVCSRVLDAELGVEPSGETRRLYERIRDGSVPSDPLDPPATLAAAHPAADGLRDLQAHLRQLQSSFVDLEKRTELLMMELKALALAPGA